MDRQTNSSADAELGISSSPQRITPQRSSTSAPAKRFKDLVGYVVDLKKTNNLNAFIDWAPGNEPGVDVHSMDGRFEAVHCDCAIQIVDYCEEHIIVNKTATNETLPRIIAGKMPTWAKVRWINVDGLSWDVIKTLAIRYDLHPLSVEDLLHIPQRTKVDYYTNSIFACLQLHLLEADSLKTGDQNGAEVSYQNSDPSTENHAVQSNRCTPSCRTSLLHYKNAPKTNLAKAYNVRANKMHIELEQCSIFVQLKENTLITFFQYSGDPVTMPLITRLKQSKTLLRTSNDPIFLMQAIIDAIVDHSIPIVDKYRDQVTELESSIMIQPEMSYTRELHLINSELMILKRTLTPIIAIVQSLRDYTAHLNGGRNESHKDGNTRLSYLFLDVHDHISSVVENLETLSKVADNLINLIFNTISYQTNESMRILSYLNMLFLPCTFLAGVYGTNFTHFPDLERPEGLMFFWKQCIAVTIICVVGFTYPWWSRFLHAQYHHYIRRKRQ
ncbi:uncharacterized protein VTP21DRAFT_8504 [Calcarisporiella thermophila]|uniref:uncharacterized protein n=1 Tax=Calcarisporiella thermophila TaxID=911321 RepID=UPI0037438FC1